MSPPDTQDLAAENAALRARLAQAEKTLEAIRTRGLDALAVTAPAVVQALDRKRAQEALQRSEARLRMAQVAAGAGMWEWDIATGKLEWSEELFRLFGLEPQTGVATFDTWRSVLHPEDRPLAEARIQTAVNDRTPLSSEYRVVLPSGAVRWIHSLGRTSYDSGGKPTCMSGICTDITERKRAEQALREAHATLESRVQERTAQLQQANESLRLEGARLDALLRLSQMSGASVAEMAQFVLEHGISLTRSRIGFVGFLSDDEQICTLHAVSKDVVKECAVEGNPVQWHVAEAGIWAEAIRQRRTLFVNDYSQPHPSKHGFPPGHLGVERFMVVPVLESGRIVAVAGVANKTQAYDAGDERQVALLLRRMWSFVQQDRAREALQAAHDSLEQRVAERTAELRAANTELAQFNQAMVGRELRMLELKQEVNNLCVRLGQPPRYAPGAEAEPPSPGVLAS